MIRPVLNVDLPGIIYSLDARARAHQSEFAYFVVAPEAEEPRNSRHALLRAFLPIAPDAHTWIAEERWRLLGLAQARSRPGANAWDFSYLAAIAAPGGESPRVAYDDVLRELLEYALNAALQRGVLRFFARIEEDTPEIELFTRSGFQRYAREVTYAVQSAHDALSMLESALEVDDSPAPLSIAPDEPAQLVEAQSAGGRHGVRGALQLLPRVHATPAPEAIADVPLRRWHQYDAWGLMRLYSACTPHRVQIAEGLSSDELVSTRAGGGRTWTLPLLEPSSVAYVLDRGVRLGGWLRLRYGRGTQPHMLSLLVHPEEEGVARALLRFGLETLASKSERPVLCQVRDYESTTVNTLNAAGFDSLCSHALLVRHLAARVVRSREAHVSEPRVVYGVKGLSASPARLSEGEKTYYARDTQ